MASSIIVIANNIRSAHNIGSIMRTSEGLGVKRLYLTGFSPYPELKNDQRLPHITAKVSQRIAKTSLNADKTLDWRYSAEVEPIIVKLKRSGYQVVALELTPRAADISAYKPTAKTALLLGNEVRGIETNLLKIADEIVKIPMAGQKESLNVAVAAAIAIYHLRYALKLAKSTG